MTYIVTLRALIHTTNDIKCQDARYRYTVSLLYTRDEIKIIIVFERLIKAPFPLIIIFSLTSVRTRSVIENSKPSESLAKSLNRDLLRITIQFVVAANFSNKLVIILSVTDHHNYSFISCNNYHAYGVLHKCKPVSANDLMATTISRNKNNTDSMQ